MNGVLGHIWLSTCKLNWAKESPEDGEMNEMTLPSRHRIRNSSPVALRLSTLPLGHGGSPQYWLSHVDGEEAFLFLSNGRDREPNPELWRERQRWLIWLIETWIPERETSGIILCPSNPWISWLITPPPLPPGGGGGGVRVVWGARSKAGWQHHKMPANTGVLGATEWRVNSGSQRWYSIGIGQTCYVSRCTSQVFDLRRDKSPPINHPGRKNPFKHRGVYLKHVSYIWINFYF